MSFTSSSKESNSAPIQKIEGFSHKFGENALILAYHAALPLAFTPKFLYSLWAKFQRDVNDKHLEIPWIAVSDLLLSNLCHEVGQELYEMDEDIRVILLSRLQCHQNFGNRRIKEISYFLLDYADQKLQNHEPDTIDFAQVQRWTALAYIRAERVAKELAQVLSESYEHDQSDLLRLTAIVEALEEPLAQFESLLIYAKALSHFVKGNTQLAMEYFSQLRRSHGSTVEGLKVHIPGRKYYPRWHKYIYIISFLIGFLGFISLAVFTGDILNGSNRFQAQENKDQLKATTTNSEKSDEVSDGYTTKASEVSSEVPELSSENQLPQITEIDLLPSEPDSLDIKYSLEEPDLQEPYVEESITSASTVPLPTSSELDTEPNSNNSDDNTHNMEGGEVNEIEPSVSVLLNPQQSFREEVQPERLPEDFDVGEISSDEIDLITGDVSISDEHSNAVGNSSFDSNENNLEHNNQLAPSQNGMTLLPSEENNSVSRSVSIPSPDIEEIAEDSTNTPSISETLLPESESEVPLIRVERVEILGSTIFNGGDLSSFITQLEGRDVKLLELQQTADAITQIYFKNGYITSRAILVAQEIIDGVVRIQVVEGEISELEIIISKPESIQISSDYISGYIGEEIRKTTLFPFNISTLEVKLREIRNYFSDNYDLTVDANLSPTEIVGQSKLTINVYSKKHKLFE